jgi:formylglycine-generating enzyme
VRVWIYLAVVVLLFSTVVASGTVSGPRKVATTGKKSVPLYTGKPGAKIGDSRINPKDGAQMMWVPAGEFLMGESEGIAENSQHKVRLSGYWMYKYEVTVKQYRKFCKETGRKMPFAPRGGWMDDHPVVNVTWSDAAAYAKWAGASLPTEAQWEKAARGVDERAFPWGNEWDSSKCANNADRTREALLCTRPVGGCLGGASPYGCTDMAGNAWEWCKDWYQPNYYSQMPTGGWVDPQGPLSSAGGDRVLRSGSWFNHHVYRYYTYARSAYRSDYRPYGRNDGYDDCVGFRLAR